MATLPFMNILGPTLKLSLDLPSQMFNSNTQFSPSYSTTWVHQWPRSEYIVKSKKGNFVNCADDKGGCAFYIALKLLQPWIRCSVFFIRCFSYSFRNRSKVFHTGGLWSMIICGTMTSHWALALYPWRRSVPVVSLISVLFPLHGWKLAPLELAV